MYILTNKRNTVLYVGITNNLARRLTEHRTRQVPGFTKRYHIDKLVYAETTEDINAAILREKQLKGGPRKKKISLIESVNPLWNDLSALM